MGEPMVIERVAEWVERRGLWGPALFLLEISRPFAWIGGQVLWMLEPFTALFAPKRGWSARVEAWAEFLEEPDAVRRLIDVLERRRGEGEEG